MARPSGTSSRRRWPRWTTRRRRCAPTGRWCSATTHRNRRWPGSGPASSRWAGPQHASRRTWTRSGPGSLRWRNGRRAPPYEPTSWPSRPTSWSRRRPRWPQNWPRARRSSKPPCRQRRRPNCRPIRPKRHGTARLPEPRHWSARWRICRAPADASCCVMSMAWSVRWSTWWRSMKAGMPLSRPPSVRVSPPSWSTGGVQLRLRWPPCARAASPGPS